MTVTCPKCSVRGQSGERWHATGRRNTNRYGRRRAELVCDVCGYAFSSGLPAALEAAEGVSGVDDVQPPPKSPAAPRVLRVIPGTFVQPPEVRRQRELEPVGALVKDWKLKQAGDE